jgi:hypothetical protein
MKTINSSGYATHKGSNDAWLNKATDKLKKTNVCNSSSHALRYAHQTIHTHAHCARLPRGTSHRCHCGRTASNQNTTAATSVPVFFAMQSGQKPKLTVGPDGAKLFQPKMTKTKTATRIASEISSSGYGRKIAAPKAARERNPRPDFKPQVCGQRGKKTLCVLATSFPSSDSLLERARQERGVILFLFISILVWCRRCRL